MSRCGVCIECGNDCGTNKEDCLTCASFYDGENYGRAATIAEVCAWLRTLVREIPCNHRGGKRKFSPMVHQVVDAIERGDTRPRGDGSERTRRKIK